MKKLAIGLGLVTVFPAILAILWLDDLGVFGAPSSKAP